MKLSEINIGEKAVIVKVAGHGGFRRRIVEMGFVKGKTVEALQRAPLGDPTEYEVMGYKVSLRNSEAERIEVISESEARREAEEEQRARRNGEVGGEPLVVTDDDIRETALRHRREIVVALVGNPNAGKTSLFNVISGLRERVGNYSGVTVDAKETLVDYKGYKIRLVDLPGTYSLSAYSPEERYVRQQIVEGRPDVIVNVIDSGNLERNLFLTTQLLDMNLRMVSALNMYDELEKKGDRFDYKSLGDMIGVPMVPTVSTQMKGITELFDTVIKLYEGEMESARHVHINYGAVIEEKITRIKKVLTECGLTFEDYTARYIAIRMLVGDSEMQEYVEGKCCNDYKRVVDECVRELTVEFKDTPENIVQDAKYGFISGALKETYQARERRGGRTMTERIDDIVTSKVWGYPIFLAAVYVMFQATFVLGSYPMKGIEWCVDWLACWTRGLMPAGVLCDLLTDGIIQGVGGVLQFLPNILILYFFINLMEASGYMARAAFIMDKIMHHIGLHGRSFIPLIMGFGCNVPAVMATRTIENRNARMVTVMIIPLMACSARLPIFLMMAGAFFSPRYAGTVLFMMYIVGVVLAGVMAKIFRRFLFSEEEVPFVMELPPYRFPTIKMLARDTWDKCEQYLKKIGTTILVGSIIIWALSYFPQHEAGELDGSYLAKVSQVVQPLVKPLGFDWKMTASLISGVAAKEIVVSTMEILYQGGLPSWDMATVMSFMLFVLIYMPCIATIGAIRMETRSWRWALFAASYTIVLAWIVSAVVFQSVANGIWQEVVAGGVVLWAVVRVILRIFCRKRRNGGCDNCNGNSSCSSCSSCSRSSR